MTEEEVFEQAIELPVEQRKPFLRDVCGGDRKLETRLLDLLVSHDEVGILDEPCSEADTIGSFLEQELNSADPFSEHRFEASGDIDSALLSGTSFGDYLIEDEIGRGSMGRVYRAIQTSLNRPVALKLIRNSLLVGNEAVRRFHAEAEAAAALDHPNLIPIYQVGEEDGLHYYSMKLVEGETLSSHIGTLKEDTRKAVELIRKVALAIHHAHQKRLLHCDIKPGNILMDREGNPLVGDFGLVTHFDSAEFHGDRKPSVEGSPYYMAPEQADGEGHTLTTTTDVFSIGAVLYEAVTGKKAFQAASIKESLQKIIHSAPDNPGSLSGDVDKDLSAIILKCLEKDPANRYQSAYAVAVDLQRWLRGEPVVARTVGAGTRLLKWVRRSPAYASLWIVLVLMLFSLGIGGYLTAHQQSLLRISAEKLAENEAQAAEIAQGLAERNRRNLYFAEMNAASQLDASGRGRLRTTLERWIPEEGESDLRGWEWNYLNSLGRNQVLVYEGHTSEITGASWSPDGKWIATCGNDRGIRVWSSETGEEEALLKVSDRFSSIAWHPDGEKILAGSWNGSVVLWNPFSGGPIEKFSPGEGLDRAASTSPVSAIAWAPGGDRFVVGSRGGSIGLYRSDSREPELFLNEEFVIVSLSWSSDGAHVAIGTSGMDFEVIDAITGEKYMDPPRGELRVRTLDWHPSENLIAGESDRFSIVVLETPNWQNANFLSGHFDHVSSIAWSPSGERIASASWDHTVRVWNMERLRTEQVFYGRNRTGALSWSPDGTRLVFADGNLARVCDTAEVEPKVLGKRRHFVRQVEWNPDGVRYLTSSGDGSISIWDADREIELLAFRSHKTTPRCAHWSPDGNQVVSVSEEIMVWDPETGEILNRWKGHKGTSLDAAWFPDGDRIATVGTDDRIRIWSVDGKEMIREISATVSKTRERAFIAISPDGDLIAAPAFNGRVNVWKAESGLELIALDENQDNVLAMKWAPEGQLLAIGYQSGQLAVFDPGSSDPRWSLPAHHNRVHEVAWSPDGDRIATVGGDRMLKLWDSTTGAACLTLRAHDQRVSGLDWSPDGSRIVTGSPDTTSKVWDTGIRRSK